MLKVFASLFLIVEGIQTISAQRVLYCEEKECKHFPMPAAMPQTNEDLQEICTPAIETLECEIRHLESCEPDDIQAEIHKNEELIIGDRILGTIKDICSEDTLLHAAVVDNLVCFKNLAENERRLCNFREGPSERIQEFAEALSEEGIISLTDDVNDTLKIYDCIDFMSFFACHSLHLEKDCGTVAMDAYIEIIQRIGPVAFERNCDVTYNLLPALIRLHRLEEEIQSNIIEVFRKRK